MGIQMVSLWERTLDPLPPIPQPAAFLIPVHHTDIQSNSSTFISTFYEYPGSITSHRGTSHCHALANVFIFSSCFPPLLLSSVLDRQRQSFNQSCHPCSNHLNSPQSPWRGLSISLPASLHLIQSTLFTLALLLPLHHVPCMPILGLLTISAILDQKACLQILT